MDQPASAGRTRGAVVTRIVGVVLTTLFGIPFLALVWLVLDSKFNPASTDYHGYGLIFGSVFAMAFALATSLVVPLIFPRGQRAMANRVSAVTLGVVTAGLLAAWITGT